MIIKTLQKSLALIAVAACLFSFTTLPATNFSGTWNLNEGKSDLGQFGARGVASKLMVDQKGNDVTITRTSPAFGGGDPTVSTETLMADGKESESTVFRGAKKKSTLKWSGDGSGFTVTYSIAFDNNGQSFELKGSETWGLSADGKTLTLQTSLSTPNGDVSTKAAYDKQ